MSVCWQNRWRFSFSKCWPSFCDSTVSAQKATTSSFSNLPSLPESFPARDNTLTRKTTNICFLFVFHILLIRLHKNLSMRTNSTSFMIIADFNFELHNLVALKTKCYHFIFFLLLKQGKCVAINRNTVCWWSRTARLGLKGTCVLCQGSNWCKTKVN